MRNSSRYERPLLRNKLFKNPGLVSQSKEPVKKKLGKTKGIKANYKIQYLMWDLRAGTELGNEQGLRNG